MARFYKRDPAAALHGMACLTLEQRGAYNTILDTMYLYEQPLPDDDRYLAGLLGVDMRVWRRLKRELIAAGKLGIDGGVITNLRATYELATLQVQRSQRVASGQLGGISSGISRKNKALAEAPASTRLDKTRVEEKKESANALSKSARASPNGFDAFWKICNKKVAKETARKRYGDAIRRKDVTAELLLQRMTAYAEAEREHVPRQFWTRPSVWLGEGRWADEELPQPRACADRPKAWQDEEAERSRAFNSAFEEVFGNDA